MNTIIADDEDIHQCSKWIQTLKPCSVPPRRHEDMHSRKHWIVCGYVLLCFNFLLIFPQALEYQI